jgi:hypothetical protein
MAGIVYRFQGAKIHIISPCVPVAAPFPAFGVLPSCNQDAAKKAKAAPTGFTPLCFSERVFSIDFTLSGKHKGGKTDGFVLPEVREKVAAAGGVAGRGGKSPCQSRRRTDVPRSGRSGRRHFSIFFSIFLRYVYKYYLCSHINKKQIL